MAGDVGFWELLWQAWRLRPVSLDAVTWSHALYLAVLVATSQLVGNAVAVVLNRMRGWVMVAWDLLSAVWVLAGQGLVGVLLWLALWLVTGHAPALGTTVRVAVLASAPLVLGFIEMTPMVGPALDRLLHVWAFAVLWTATELATGLPGWHALAAAALAWLGQQLLRVLARPPGRYLRAWALRRWSGPSDPVAAELLLEREVGGPA